MTFIPVPHGAMVSIRFTKGGEDFSNTFWLVKEDYTSGDLTTLADDMDAQFAANYKGYFSSGVSYLETVAYDMRSDGGEVVSNADGAGACSGAASVAPIGLAVVVTCYSNTRGRSGRGRKYVSGLPEAQLESGIWLQAAADSALGYVSNMCNTPSTKGWDEVIVSRYHNGAARLQAETYSMISRTVRSLIPGSQRRRFDRP